MWGNRHSTPAYERMMRAQVRAVVNVYNDGKAGRWPMPVFPDSPIIGLYSSPYIARLMWDALSRSADNADGREMIRRAYRYPSRLARTPHLYPQRALWTLAETEQRQFGDIVATILAGMYRGSAFCEDGSNVLYAPDEVARRLAGCEKYLIEGHHDILRQLAGSLWMLTESFFPRWHNTFHEYSGPYPHGARLLLIKEFHDLKPYYLPMGCTAYPFEHLAIIEEYETGATFHFDLHNRVSYGPRNALLLTRYAVTVDQEPQALERLPAIIAAVREALRHSVRHLQSMDKRQMIIFNGRAEHYALVHPLAAIADVPDDMPREFYQRATRPEITPREQAVWDWIKNMPNDAEGFRRLFDVTAPTVLP